ncbi:MAG: LacI family DNA-binding transcriptional regulator [Anaerolineaceae bacterium]|nr:LacI family DNA-binding transcriptional regulator [Anaerolineaceae bacterium]
MTDDTIRKTAPTIRDVARKAGVSTASVSRVLNKREVITDDLYFRVTAAIQELGYRPQRNRARPATPSPWLFVLTETIDDPFFLQIISGIQEKAEEEGFLPTILPISSRRNRLADTLEQLKSQPSVGILAAGVYLKPEEWIDYQTEINVPIVVINTRITHPRIASVMVDFEAASYQATQHLLSLNHTRIAFVGNYDNEFAAAELQGVKSALATRGIDYPDEYRFSVTHTPEGASQAISKMMLLPAEKRPTAIFAFDDQLAILVLNAMRYYRLRVPEDISVIGFDNIPMSAHSNPPLTTIDIPKRRIGRMMVMMIQDLLSREKDEDGLGTTIIEGSLIVRSSTGPAPTLNGMEK